MAQLSPSVRIFMRDEGYGVDKVDFVVGALRFSVTLCKCVLANPVKIAFGTCQHCDCVLPKTTKKSQHPIPKKHEPKAMLAFSLFRLSTHSISCDYTFYTIWLCFMQFFRTFISLVIHFHSYLHGKSTKYW